MKNHHWIFSLCQNIASKELTYLWTLLIHHHWCAETFFLIILEILEIIWKKLNVFLAQSILSFHFIGQTEILSSEIVRYCSMIPAEVYRNDNLNPNTRNQIPATIKFMRNCTPILIFMEHNFSTSKWVIFEFSSWNWLSNQYTIYKFKNQKMDQNQNENILTIRTTIYQIYIDTI